MSGCMYFHIRMEKLNTETIFDDLEEGIQLIGFDWKYLYVNDSVVKQSKYSSKHELLGYTMMDKYPGIEESKLFETLKRCMKFRTSATLLNEFIFPDGSKGQFDLRIEPASKGLFIWSREVTEQNGDS